MEGLFLSVFRALASTVSKKGEIKIDEKFED